MSIGSTLKVTDENGDLKKSILLVGDITSDLKQFASEVLHEADIVGTDVNIYTTDRLPLTDGNVVASLLVIIVDLSNKETLTSSSYFLQFIPKEFFIGRLIFVGLNVNNEQSWSIEPEEISDLARQCACPVLWGSVNNAQSMSILSKQILKKLECVTTNQYPTVLCTGLSNLR
uniref:Centromere protein M n=1 Tax=Phallusia mammillata TaxID=59560 RepID=A0A6F9D9K8_9ASCI|nr:centromere protein M-like [Phallusia mammillata]